MKLKAYDLRLVDAEIGEAQWASGAKISAKRRRNAGNVRIVI
jgi:hypothetical protein